MKIKWFFIVFLILSLLILTSCASSGGLGSRFSGIFGGREGPVGGRGVILKFIDAPENNEELTEQDVIQLGIEIENHVPGETGLSGQVCVRDTLTSNYGGIPEDACLPVELPPATDIEGKITPTIDAFQFGPYQYSNLEETYTLPTIMFADLKYETQSTAISSMCVKRKNVQSGTMPQNCGEKQTARVQQPDLPIKVSKLETKSIPSDTEARVQLEITLKKVNQGQVVTSGNILNDQSQAASAEVEFEATVNRQPMTCIASGSARIEFRQNENEKLVKCSANLQLEGDHFDAPISIKMSYGFIQSIQGRTIKLRKEEAFI